MNDIEQLCEEIKQATGCLAVQGDVLPLPPSSLPDRLTLVINCFVEQCDSARTSPELLVGCRRTVDQALDCIETFVQRKDIGFDIVGVSVIQLHGLTSSVRVYWANSRRDLLQGSEHRVVCEGSHVADIRALL